MESFGIIIDCVTMTFVTCSFVVLLEIANRLKSNDKRFDKIYERSTCPPKKRIKDLLVQTVYKKAAGSAAEQIIKSPEPDIQELDIIAYKHIIGLLIPRAFEKLRGDWGVGYRRFYTHLHARRLRVL